MAVVDTVVDAVVVVVEGARVVDAGVIELESPEGVDVIFNSDNFSSFLNLSSSSASSSTSSEELSEELSLSMFGFALNFFRAS